MAAQSVLKVVLKNTNRMSLNEQVTNMLKHKQPMPASMQQRQQLVAETETDPADAELALCVGSTET